LIVTFRFLGNFDAQCGEQPVSGLAKKSVGLLAALAVSPDGRASRSFLASLLWGDRANDQARDSLRQGLASFKRAFKDLDVPILNADREYISLNQQIVDTDIQSFVSLAGGENLKDLAEAVSLYNGSFLKDIEINDLGFQNWQETEREKLQSLGVSTLETLLSDQGLPKNASDRLNWAEKLTDIDPYNETAARHKIDYFGTVGEMAKASREYDRIRAILLRELEIEPSIETIDIYQRVIDAQESGPGNEASRKSATQEDTSFLSAPLTDAPQQKRIETSPPRIAVMPLRNLSGDPEQAYFVDGVTEEIIISLSTFRSMRVVSSQSSFSYLTNDQDPSTISRSLNVSYLVSGSLRKSNDRIRINLELIDGSSGENLWASRFDGKIEDIFDIQDSISKAIAAGVIGQIERSAIAGARRKPTDHLSAYDLFLRGNEQLNSVQKSENLKARDYFNRALEIDGDFARAHSSLAIAHFDAVFMGWEEGDLVRQGVEHAEKAAQLDPVDSHAHLALGMLKFLQREFGSAEFHMQTAHHLNESDTEIMIFFSIILAYAGRPREALMWIDKAIELNPLHPEYYYTVHGTVLFWAGRYKEALQQYNRRQTHDRLVLAYMAACQKAIGKDVDPSSLKDEKGDDDICSVLVKEIALYREKHDQDFLHSMFASLGLVPAIQNG